MGEKLVETPREKTKDRDEGCLMTKRDLLLANDDCSCPHTLYMNERAEVSFLIRKPRKDEIIESDEEFDEETRMNQLTDPIHTAQSTRIVSTRS